MAPKRSPLLVLSTPSADQFPPQARRMPLPPPPLLSWSWYQIHICHFSISEVNLLRFHGKNHFLGETGHALPLSVSGGTESRVSRAPASGTAAVAPFGQTPSFVMQFLILFILLKSNKHKTTYIVCHLKYLCQTGCKCEPQDWSTNF